MAEKEYLFIFEAEESDIITGDITDREAELSLAKVKTMEMFYLEEGEIVRKLEKKDFNMNIEETGLLQRKLGVELELSLPRYDVKFMHNNDERKAFATQVEDLTDGQYSWGDFDFQDGYAVNQESKMIIVMTEENLQQRALFRKVREEFDFGYDSDKLVPSFKTDRSDINYLVRENNELGVTEHNGKSYRVFKENAYAHGDSPTAIMLELDTFSANFSVDSQSYDSSLKTNSFSEQVFDPETGSWVEEETLEQNVSAFITVEDLQNDLDVIVHVETYTNDGEGFEYRVSINDEEHDCLKHMLSEKFGIEYDDPRIDDFIDVAIKEATPELVQRAKHDHFYARKDQILDNYGLEMGDSYFDGDKLALSTEYKITEMNKSFNVINRENGDIDTIPDAHYKEFVYQTHSSFAPVEEDYVTVKETLGDLAAANFHHNRDEIEEFSLSRKKKLQNEIEEPKQKTKSKLKI
ncbi:Pentapeptide repeat-containing protein [Vibrio chagasii]|nr:Pentapeptide repeat-containing protein [Vibrio chagasii]